MRILLDYFLYIFKIFTLIIIQSCSVESNYFPLKENVQKSYNIFFTDKENKKKHFKQFYTSLKSKDNLHPILRNDGQISFYLNTPEGLIRKSNDYFFSSFISLPRDKLDRYDNQTILKYPVKEGVEWTNNDKTNIIMKLGYDRVYQTFLPFEMRNVIISVNEIVNIEGKKFFNCIKVEGNGTASYNPGPPLDNIDIKIKTESWYAPNFGLVKHLREEQSNSETMGTIFYEKVINL